MKLSQIGTGRRKATMIDVNKLRGKMAERQETMATLANKLNMAPSTLFRRLQAEGSSFTVKEISLIKEALRLSNEDVLLIFLPDESQIGT